MGEAHWIREVTPRTCGGIPLAIAASHLTEQLAPYLRGYPTDYSPPAIPNTPVSLSNNH